ncbi:LysR family transcriptional regulator [Terrilactibacillus laevilacticus]|uniref:LysR family transcriptional regulator n=1 Tax=Terrilactibacillus laevilacticus TaxID=1380157 RepID=A0ABW5PUM5_9BACI|nr:LysR family transcriptional regulator [Terrilactibacillus laevilacticus]
MNKQGIEAFLAIVRNKSLTDAAESLFLSQSSLSHRLVQLEKEVGVGLIERGRGLRKITLTDAGEEFLKIARKWEELMEETALIQSRAIYLSLSIGAVDSVHRYILPPVYRTLSQYREKVNIRVRTQQSIELHQLFEMGEIDVAFTLLEHPIPNAIIEEFVSEEMIIVRKEEGSSKNYERILTIRDLDFSKQLFIDWGSAFRAWHENWINEHTDHHYPRIHLDTAQLLLTFMTLPGQWAIVPISMTRSFEKMKGFSIYRLDDPPPNRICYIIKPRFPKKHVIESLNILESCLEKVHKEDLKNVKRM